LVTPSAPPEVEPKQTGLAIKNAFAPKAIALKNIGASSYSNIH